MIVQSDFSSKQLSVSAPGKLMLLGEHAVVYGYPCLVTAIDKLLTVSVRKSTKSHDQIIAPESSDTRYVEKAIRLVRRKFPISGSLLIKTRSELGSYGLGSSSAVTVAVIKALTLWLGKFLPNKSIFNLSYHVVRSVQGQGSGFDVAASLYGGIIFFDGKAKKVTDRFQINLPISVGYSSVKAQTVHMVEKVGHLKKTRQKYVSSIFSSIASLVEKGAVALKEKNWRTFGQVMNENHKMLQLLGVSTPKLDAMVSSACKAGAYGAKLSGAGGGDCMIALVPTSSKEAVDNAIRASGGEIIPCKVSFEGVRH